MLQKFKDLGIDSDSEEWQKFDIILSKVSAYMPCYNEQGELIDENTTVYLSSEQCFIIHTPYENFDKIMTEYLCSK